MNNDPPSRGIAGVIAARLATALLVPMLILLVVSSILLLASEPLAVRDPGEGSMGGPSAPVADPAPAAPSLWSFAMMGATAAMGGIVAEAMRNGGVVTLPKREARDFHLGTLMGALVGVCGLVVTELVVDLASASPARVLGFGFLAGLGAKSTLDSLIAAKEMPDRAEALLPAAKKRPRTRTRGASP